MGQGWRFVAMGATGATGAARTDAWLLLQHGLGFPDPSSLGARPLRLLGGKKGSGQPHVATTGVDDV